MFFYFLLFVHIFAFLNANALNQLSFSGGGSFGAVEIGILKRILETENKVYDLYTGISAGALNAGFLSYFSNLKSGIKSAEKLYDSMHNLLVYKLDPFTGISILNTDPLFKTLTKVINGMPTKPAVHTLIGATNPADAAEGTIRKKYATSIGENAVHGSDSDENAAIEGAFHFAGREQF